MSSVCFRLSLDCARADWGARSRETENQQLRGEEDDEDEFTDEEDYEDYEELVRPSLLRATVRSR